MKNPFIINGYQGSKYFCDREDETKKIVSNLKNGINTTLLSIRRIGKTGLIHHVFNKIQTESTCKCIYIDLYATQNLNDLIEKTASAFLSAFPEKKQTGKKLMQLIKGFRPVIQFDTLSGEPQITFDFKQEIQMNHTLQSLFTFLENQQTKTILAFDEFQQINEYPEKNTEAILRTIIQNLNNVQFIFSGSSKHLLMDIFNNSKRPFFASTQAIQLGFIPIEKYSNYIQQHFESNKKHITQEAIYFILDWSKRHTYYTQVVCNRLFSLELKNITIKDVHNSCNQLLNEQEVIFFQYRNLLTSGQWKVLKAIANEGKVYQMLEKQFIQKHALGATSSTQRTFAALLHKEMIFEEQEIAGSYFSIYDCFLSRWLEKL